MEKERLARQALQMKIDGRRPRGRPRYRWEDQIRGKIQRRGFSWSRIEEEEMWNVRDRWRISKYRPQHVNKSGPSMDNL
ncbi:hypothetical protein, partial [Streptococcus anginosus]|uniref:hypothetical protein n=1 Tax=Streptococcus anginosus TaxID=1328 RepID=UPI002ED88430